MLGDNGFEGLEAGAAGVVTPNKRPQGGANCTGDFAGSTGCWRAGASRRGHTFASVKRLRILRDEFRNRRKGMVDQVMVIGCTLHNFRFARQKLECGIQVSRLMQVA